MDLYTEIQQVDLQWEQYTFQQPMLYSVKQY